MNWFDDTQWKTIARNMSLFAQIAKEGHCVGLCFDPEPYGKNPWGFGKNYPGKSFDEVAAQVRKRGAQFMNAVQKEMPRLRLLTFFQLSLFRGLANETDATKRTQRLMDNHYALLPAFLNGMLDAAGPDVAIIDGNESSYYYWKPKQFYEAHHSMKSDCLAFVDPKLWRKYRGQVHAGMALYMDQIFALRQPKGGFPSYFMSPDTRARWFEQNVYCALASSDDYVWCCSERLSWWANRTPKGAEQAIISAKEKLRKGESLGYDIINDFEKARQLL